MFNETSWTSYIFGSSPEPSDDKLLENVDTESLNYRVSVATQNLFKKQSDTNNATQPSEKDGLKEKVITRVKTELSSWDSLGTIARNFFSAIYNWKNGHGFISSSHLFLQSLPTEEVIKLIDEIKQSNESEQVKWRKLQGIINIVLTPSQKTELENDVKSNESVSITNLCLSTKTLLLVEYLLDDNTDNTRFTSEELWDGLTQVVCKGDVEKIKKLIEKADISDVIERNDESNGVLLANAVLSGNNIILKLLVDKGITNFNNFKKTGNTLASSMELIFKIRSEDQQSEMLKYLLSLGDKLDINGVDENGSTALHWLAVKGNHPHLVEILLQDPHVENKRREGTNGNETALELAKKSQNKDSTTSKAIQQLLKKWEITPPAPKSTKS